MQTRFTNACKFCNQSQLTNSDLKCLVSRLQIFTTHSSVMFNLNKENCLCKFSLTEEEIVGFVQFISWHKSLEKWNYVKALHNSSFMRYVSIIHKSDDSSFYENFCTAIVGSHCFQAITLFLCPYVHVYVVIVCIYVY